MIQNTRLAKCVYWLSCKVSHIKTYSQTYRMQNEEEWLASEGDIEMMFVKNGRTWSSTKYTWRLLDLANALDWDHFEHWAYDHERCDGEKCEDCGGIYCVNGC